MDEVHLKHAYEVLRQIAQQQKYANIKIDKQLVDFKINRGIEQLDNGDGADFRLFLNEMQEKYAKMK